MSFRTNALKVQAFAGAVYGIQVGTTTMAQINADITSAGGLSNALNGYYASSFGSVANATVATSVATNLGLTGTALTSGAAYITAQLNAAAPAARGAVISNILDLFAGLASDATFGAAATAWNTKVDAANAYTGSANVAIGSTVGTGSTFTLTTGMDTGAAFTGTAGNNTFDAVEVLVNGVATSVWTAGDSIDGAGGADTFNVVQTGAITVPAAARVTNIEVANLTSGAGVTADASGWTGLETLNTSGVGAAAVTAAATTNVNITSTAVAATEIAANGGNNLTLNLTGFSANAGGPAGGVAVGGTTAASGNVVVNVTGIAGNAAGTTATNTGIAVTGGDSITVNQLAANAVNTTVTHSEVSITGDAQTTAVTVNNAAAATAAAAVAGRSVGAAIAITDVAEAAGIADKIATVTLANFGATVITSSALSTLNVTGGSTAALASGALTLTAQSATTPATTLALNSSGGFMGAIAGTQAGAYTTINVNSSAATTIANLTSAAVQTLNFTGSGNTTLTASTLGAALTDINVTGTGGVSLGTAIAGTTDFDGSVGNDTITITGAATQGYTMGDGDDQVTFTAGTIAAAGMGALGSLAGGNGTDRLVMAEADAAAADNNSAFNTDVTGFETLRLVDGGVDGLNTATIDVDGLNDVSRVELAAAVAYDGTYTISNINTGGTLELRAASLANNAGDGGDGLNTAAVVVNVQSALAAPTDTFNVVLTNATAGAVVFDDVALANVETVSITTNDTGTVADVAATVDSLVLVATSATTITVAGNNGLTLTNTGNAAVTRFDASGVAGNTAADTAANLAVTFASVNATANAAVSITGGAGDDVLTGSAAAINRDTINGGAGDDDITGGTGQDTLTGGADRDAFIFAAGSSTTAASDSITDFTMASAATAGTVGAWSGGNGGETANEFQAATFGGANADILDMAVTAVRANVTGAAGQAAGVTFSVASGILTVGGANAANVDTLGEWITEADAAAGNALVAFEFGGNTYVYEGTNNDLVQLVGVTGAAAIAAAAENTAIVANTILVI